LEGEYRYSLNSFNYSDRTALMLFMSAFVYNGSYGSGNVRLSILSFDCSAKFRGLQRTTVYIRTVPKDLVPRI